MEQQTGRILVVDDEPMNVLVLKGLLGNAGYTVYCASSGPEGLELALAEKPDMVLLDVMMPGESGFDTCRKLKEDPLTSGIPVVFITCLGEMSNKLAGLDMGAVDYITKPFNSAEVLARVRSHMEYQRRNSSIIDAQASRLSQVQAAQKALLARPDELPEARFAVYYLPVLEAGGDFYEVLDFGGGRYAYFVADVSGHDLGASFITSSLKALFRQHAAPGKSPSNTLAAMNRILCAITPDEVYLTAAYLFIDRSQNRFSLCSAGHPPVLAQQEGAASLLDLDGSPLGFFEDVTFSSRQGSVRPGDRFYLYTDGLAEGLGLGLVTGGRFRDRMTASCMAAADSPLAVAVETVAKGFMGAAGRPTDDIVLLGVDV
jgi:sigma-B regulation protein RsbU (phosphoserine phosphatase)